MARRFGDRGDAIVLATSHRQTYEAKVVVVQGHRQGVATVLPKKRSPGSFVAIAARPENPCSHRNQIHRPGCLQYSDELDGACHRPSLGLKHALKEALRGA